MTRKSGASHSEHGVTSSPNLRWQRVAAFAGSLAIIGAALIIFSLSDSRQSDLQRKLAAFCGLSAGLGLYLAIRSLQHGAPFFMCGEQNENRRLRNGSLQLKDVQQISWAPRAGRAAEYSAIALGMILVGAVLLADAGDEIDATERTLFRLVLFFGAISVVTYGVGVQLWEEAVGGGYSREACITLRTRALVLSTIGWFTMDWALVLAIITVDTETGLAAGMVGVMATIVTAESKYSLFHARDNAPRSAGYGILFSHGRLPASHDVDLNRN